MSDPLKLSVYFGESDRVAGRLLSDCLFDEFEHRGLHAAILLRAVEGFGIKQALRTDRFLSLSEDLPLLAIAVDDGRRIEAALPRVMELVAGGLVTLERAELLRDRLDTVTLPGELEDATKLTVYLGRDDRVGRRPAFLEVVTQLELHGLAGATVFLGVDGMAHGERRRARFFSRNARVPLMVVSVGPGEAVSRVLPVLGELLDDPIVTLERVRVCKRDGELLREPSQLPERDEAGLGLWQKLTVYAGEQARHAGHPLSVELVHRLRAAGAGGATSIRGIWGFSGDHPPHGDRLFAVERRVPVVTSVVDTPERIQRWFRIVDACTDEAGLVTSELVPAFRATAPDARIGGLKLAQLTPG